MSKTNGIKQNLDGTYTVQYSARHPVTRMPKTLRRKCGDNNLPIKTFAMAQKIQRQLILEVNNGFKSQIIPNWESLIGSYIQSAIEKGHSLKTVNNYELGLKAHTSQLWQNRFIDSISTEEIRSLIKDGLNGKAEGHKKNILKFIRAVFTFAVESNYIQRNPVPHIKFRQGDKIKAVLNEVQLHTLLNKAKEYDSEWYYHWCLATYTGMRSGELYALTWDKVDLTNRLIKVDCSWNNKDGFKSTKSGDDRMVEISPSLVSVLAELKLMQVDTIYVLPRLTEWTKGEQARALRTFLMPLNLPRIRFHDLRASWATVMLSKGIEPAKVMIMGGWKDLKTMMVYMRKAGISIQGITDGLILHNPSKSAAKVINIEDCRTS